MESYMVQIAEKGTVRQDWGFILLKMLKQGKAGVLIYFKC